MAQGAGAEIFMLRCRGGKTAGLGELFTRFKTRYLAGKTQHLGSITAEQLESV